MAQSTPTSNFNTQDFFSTTLSSAIAASDTTIPLVAAPTPTEGFLVIEPDSSTNREIIMYTSVSGSSVICGSTDDRGIGGTTARAHSSGVTVKMNTVSDMFKALKGGNGLSTGAISYAKAASGFVVQKVGTTTATVGQDSTTIPADNTIPQNTEGFEVITQAITPKATSHNLFIEGTIFASATTAQPLTAALFQDSTANALAAAEVYATQANGIYMIPIRHVMAAGTTSATTFKIRLGTNGGTANVNGQAATQRYSTAAKTSLFITEVKA